MTFRCLCLPELRIKTILRQQNILRALLDEPTLIQDENLIGVGGKGEIMGHCNNGAALGQERDDGIDGRSNR